MSGIVIAMEDDVALRPLQPMIDPSCSDERVAAFADYMRHDIPDFAAWCGELRRRAPDVFPARIVPVSDDKALAAAIGDADVAIVEELPVAAELLDAAPRLRLVQKYGITLSNIDVDACEARGVKVRIQRRRTNVAVAEHSMALLLALAKQLPLVGGSVTPQRLESVGHPPATYDRRHTANSNWGRFGGLRTISGATLGLVGLGEIGREVAAMARGFGMRVLYTQRTRLDPEREAEFGVTYASFDDLLTESDHVSLHAPMNEQTRDMFSEETFARMKPGAILINTARAAIVNRDALLGALRSGRLGGAGFDVLYEEPAREDDPLLDFDNVLLTPHLAGAGRFNGVNDLVDIVMAIQDLPRR